MTPTQKQLHAQWVGRGMPANYDWDQAQQWMLGQIANAEQQAAQQQAAQQQAPTLETYFRQARAGGYTGSMDDFVTLCEGSIVLASAFVASHLAQSTAPSQHRMSFEDNAAQLKADVRGVPSMFGEPEIRDDDHEHIAQRALEFASAVAG